MYKQYSHKGTDFVVHVQLNAKSERHIGGDIFHRIYVTKGSEPHYSDVDRYDYEEYISKQHSLPQAIENVVKRVTDRIDEITDIKADKQLLISLGFNE